MHNEAFYGDEPSRGPLHRDPQVLADPSGLAYGLHDSYPQESLPSLKDSSYPGAVNPNVVFTNHHTVYIPQPVIREQYCKCAPQTTAERRLLVTVIVLAIIVLMLLAALGSVIPLAACGDDCQDGNNMLDSLFPGRPLQIPIQPV